MAGGPKRRLGGAGGFLLFASSASYAIWRIAMVMKIRLRHVSSLPTRRCRGRLRLPSGPESGLPVFALRDRAADSGTAADGRGGLTVSGAGGESAGRLAGSRSGCVVAAHYMPGWSAQKRFRCAERRPPARRELVVDQSTNAPGRRRALQPLQAAPVAAELWRGFRIPGFGLPSDFGPRTSDFPLPLPA